MRIAIIEDNEALAQAIAYRLRDRGHSADVLHDGAAADRYLRQEGADLLVLDLNLPGMDGLDILAGLRARGDGVPVILLTARDDIADRVAGLDAGADDYLVKPVEVRDIVQTLNRLFGKVEGSISAHQVFISDAAHQLRNPAAAVLSMAESVQDARDEGERNRRISELIDAACDSSRVAEQLLSLDRLQQTDSARPHQVFDLDALTEKTCANIGAEVLSRGLDFEFVASDMALPVCGDPVFVSEAIKNLVDNAVKHGGPDLTGVRVSAARAGDRATVTVFDDGVRLVPDQEEKAFSRFGQIPARGSLAQNTNRDRGRDRGSHHLQSISSRVRKPTRHHPGGRVPRGTWSSDGFEAKCAQTMLQPRRSHSPNPRVLQRGVDRLGHDHEPGYTLDQPLSCAEMWDHFNGWAGWHELLARRNGPQTARCGIGFQLNSDPWSPVRQSMPTGCPAGSGETRSNPIAAFEPMARLEPYEWTRSVGWTECPLPTCGRNAPLRL